MLQAYIDESISGRQDHDFVMAGYLATYERWAEFSEKWQHALDMDPKIEYFKYREALLESGPFLGMSEERRHERIAVFRHLIEDYAQFEFSLSFRIEDYKRGFADHIPMREMKNPYFFATLELMLYLARNLKDIGFENQKIDFIFDEQVREQGEIVSAWEWIRRNYSDAAYPDNLLTEIIRRSPSFSDDKVVLPLQAADMQAARVRIDTEEARSGKEIHQIIGFRREINGFFMSISEEQFRNHINASLNIIRNFGPLKS